jgi:hypothetical protein
MNGEHSYANRVNSPKNDGEVLFEKYCRQKGCQFYKMGFDEHHKNVPSYWRFNELLRNLPDYLINIKDKSYVVAVKGTDNFKQKEINLLPQLVKIYATEQAPLIYAFCFAENNAPIWLKPDQIIERYQAGSDLTWHDGIIYRSLKLRKKT